jgi:hypothetical protein
MRPESGSGKEGRGPFRPVAARPVEAISGAKPSRLGPVARSIALAAIVMLCLGSKGLLAWTNDLPINPVSDALLALAQEWHDLMTRAGLTGYSDSVRNALRAFKALR